MLVLARGLAEPEDSRGTAPSLCEEAEEEDEEDDVDDDEEGEGEEDKDGLLLILLILLLLFSILLPLLLYTPAILGEEQVRETELAVLHARRLP